MRDDVIHLQLESQFQINGLVISAGRASDADRTEGSLKSGGRRRRQHRVPFVISAFCQVCDQDIGPRRRKEEGAPAVSETRPHLQGLRKKGARLEITRLFNKIESYKRKLSEKSEKSTSANLSDDRQSVPPIKSRIRD
ncbi:hypothetical protein EVAR_92445_1 [Eumeta japonica]|uniref:Uncharacterized protein n=1 Tax=Eumeta variegata TaxID=151549 RepID=A0A4C1T9C9_EUMVA|nr:hypothetical protein EVAR_92445_1 [Eumeta japonica]